jgi:perosamine synthetase
MIPIYQPYMHGNEKKYVNECLDSSWISSKGAFIQKFEQAFVDYTKAKHATAVANGTVALHLALDAIGIKAGDEVIVPTFTYVASINTIIQLGAKPVYIDCDQLTFNLKIDELEAKITNKTKAIMVVHLYGLPCDMKPILEICQKYNLKLVEDCAEAFGSFDQNQHVGTFGDIATFSFFGNKTITTGEGGMVVAKDKSVIDKAFHLKNQGVSQTKEYWHDILAYNYRMTNICAAIGLAQLEQADDILAKKRKIALTYQEQLNNLPLYHHIEQPNATHSYWMCSIVLNDSKNRDALRQHLKTHQIETRPFFAPAHMLPHCSSSERFRNAEDLSQAGINLPSFPDLSNEQQEKICQAIKSFF